MDRRTAAVSRGVGHLHGIVTDRAANAEIWDVEGRRYIDFAAGIAVLNTGHRHPEVMARVASQMERFTHTCFHVTLYEPYVELAERLNAIVPGTTPKKTMLVSTGAEANENAVKIARAYTGRSGVIAFAGGFHGRTLMTASLTGKMSPYKTGFGPFAPEVYHAAYPCALHGVGVDDAIASVERLFACDIDPASVAAVIVEPVQGEGGFHVAPPEFMQRLRVLCDRHGILMICDEVQTGFARTGRMFATEYAGIEPDLITLAKALAGGLPLSAVVGKTEVMDAPHPGGLGGTYAGNPLACAAALAVLDVIEQEGLVARSRAIGARLTRRLTRLAETRACIREVRGLGAMVAIELFEDGEPGRPAPDLAKALLARAADKGLLLLSCGTHGNVVRILAPLTASDALIDEGLDILDVCFRELAEEQAWPDAAADAA
jgi:4-aminobutyrate aminotransferase/(S)-3-amino-2-methylpropionate transaminase